MRPRIPRVHTYTHAREWACVLSSFRAHAFRILDHGDKGIPLTPLFRGIKNIYRPVAAGAILSPDRKIIWLIRQIYNLLGEIKR